jgi:hypothetical protein
MMALTNILNEPRREITETIVGFGIVAAFIYVDYKFAQWAKLDPLDGQIASIIVGLIVGIVLVIGIAAVLVIIHAVGQGVCNSLERHGIQLRPRKRYGKNL